MLTYILKAPWESPQLCQMNFGIVPQKRPQPLLPYFSVHKLIYVNTNLPHCQFYHNKPIWQQKKNIFYYTHTMEIVHKTVNNMKSVNISCFHYLNIICGAVITLTPELLKTYPVSNVSLEQWSISTGTHLLEGMLIPQTVTPTDNVTVQNNNNGVLSIKFWLPDAHCAYGKETDSSAQENTELKKGLNSTEFLLEVNHFYNFAIYTVTYQRFWTDPDTKHLPRGWQ